MFYMLQCMRQFQCRAACSSKRVPLSTEQSAVAEPFYIDIVIP